MVTIKDVAKHANLSVATISRYLNKKGYVSEEAKQTIEHAIAVLNYRPNELARSLSNQKSKTIGLIVPDITNPFFPEIAQAVEETAFQQGYTVILCNSGEQREKEIHYLLSLQKQYVAGFIVTTNTIESSYYNQIKLPIVALDRQLNDEISTVTSKQRQGTISGANFLIERGAKHILYMTGPQTIDVCTERLAGFLEVMQKNTSIEYDIIESPFDFKASEKIAFDFLKSNPSVDAIFGVSDVTAIGAMKAIQKLEYRIPDEIQIMGFDGTQISEMVSPSLTTVAQNIYELGAQATKLLIQKIENDLIEQRKIQLETTLQIRNSTK